MITEAAAGRPSVTRLVYLAGAVPDVGESLARLAPESRSSDTDGGEEAVRTRPDGMIELAPDAARASLFHDCPPDRVEEAVARLLPSNPAVGSQAVRAAAWRTLPVTYVRGSADRMPELLSSRVPWDRVEVVDLPTGHCPQWSRPVLDAELLAACATAGRAARDPRSRT